MSDPTTQLGWFFSARWVRGLCVVACHACVSIGMVGSTWAATPLKSPPQTRAERLTFDPAANRWMRSEPPTPGTENGDLDIIRQYMAISDYKTALPALVKWIKTYGAAAPRYPEALFLKGTSHLGLGDYRAAHDAFSALLNDFPASEYAEATLSAQFRVGEQYLAGKKRKAMYGLLRVKDREGGIKIMDDMVVNYSDTPFAEQAQLAKANYYYERGEFELAQEEYSRFARDYPHSRYQAKALLWSAYSALASFPGIKFDDASLLEAEERFHQFSRSYPGQGEQMGVPVLLDEIASTRADKTYDIAAFYERTKALNAARFYYRETVKRWPDTPAAAKAQGRIAALGPSVDVKPLPYPTAAPEAESAPDSAPASAPGNPEIVP